MSVSSNNEELRAALNRRLAKRAHRAPTRPTTAPPSAFDKKPPMPANDTVNDRPRRDVASPSGGGKRSSSPGLRRFSRSHAQEDLGDTKKQGEGVASSEGQIADKGLGKSASSEGGATTTAADSDVAKVPPRVSRSRTSAAVLSILPKFGSHKDSDGDVSESAQPSLAQEPRPRQIPPTTASTTPEAGPAVPPEKDDDRATRCAAVASTVTAAAAGGEGEQSRASIAGVHMEGYLSKLSSGKVKRWQKRYFILDGGYLGYLSAPGPADLAKKTFDLSKASNVEKADSEDPNSSDFNLIYNNNVYYMRAPSVPEMRKWMNSMQIVIAATYSGTRASGGVEASEADKMSDSAPSLGGSSNVSRLNSVTSPKPAAANNMPSTIWELDTDRLDRMFEESWFEVVDELKDEKCDKEAMALSTSKMIDGVTRCSSDLYATLAKMNSSNYTVLTYDDTHGAIEARLKGSSEERDQCLCIVQEYMQRLAVWINKWLDVRAQWKMHESHGGGISNIFSSGKNKGPVKPMAAPVLSSDFPALLEAVARLRSEINKLFGLDKADEKVASANGKRDSVSLRTRKKAECTDQNGPYHAWRQQLESVLQRLGSELETAVIEELDKQLQTTNVWEPKCQNSLGEGVHGPKLLLDRGQYCLTTSWTPHLLKTIRATFDVQATTVRSHPYSATIITEHTISGVVAVINCAWRFMKNKVARTASAINHKKGLKGKASAALGKAKRSSQKYTSSSSTSGAPARSPSADDDSPDQQRGSTSSKGSIPPLEYMVAFSNEAATVAGFCATTADDLNSRKTPETQVYGACMAGQSTAFGNLAQETGHHIAEVYFKPKYKSVISKAFNKDRLLVRVETPMTESVRNAGAFAQQLKQEGATEATNSYTVRGVLDVIVSGYIKSLCENKPKLDRFPKLPDVMAADEALVVDYFTNHKVGALDRTDVNKCIEINATIRSFLTDNDINLLMVHYLEANRLVGASKAKKIAKAVVSMRSAQWNKKQRADILKQLTKNQGGVAVSSDESP